MGYVYECRGCKVRRLEEWPGACSNCGLWYNPIRRPSDDPDSDRAPIEDGQVMPLADAVAAAVEYPRIKTRMPGFDHVLDGGFVPDSTVLLCGDPGVGKSTLILQLLQSLAKQRYDVLYLTGEESMNQVAIRAKRLGKFLARLQAAHETDIDAILDHLDEIKPAVFVIDSIPKVRVEDFQPGSSASIESAVRELRRFARETHAVGVLIGHIDKEGAIKGPTSISFDVDVVLHFAFAGNAEDAGRLLRTNKNRFGPTPREAPFIMRDSGFADLTPDPENPPPPQPKAEPVIALVPPPAKKKPAGRTGPRDTDTVLGIDCDSPDCRGRKGRACTAADGTPEVGFHASRITKSRAGVKVKKAPRKPPPQAPRVE